MNQLKEMLEAYRNGERGLPTYDELAAIAYPVVLPTPWTRFMDMHSGGGTKVKDYEYIYIQAALDEAVSYFESSFGRDPYDVACDCCGQNYSIDQHETIEQATAYERGCLYKGEKYVEEPSGESWSPYMTVEEYKNKKGVLVITQEEMTK